MSERPGPQPDGGYVIDGKDDWLLLTDEERAELAKLEAEQREKEKLEREKQGD